MSTNKWRIFLIFNVFKRINWEISSQLFVHFVFSNKKNSTVSSWRRRTSIRLCFVLVKPNEENLFFPSFQFVFILIEMKVERVVLLLSICLIEFSSSCSIRCFNQSEHSIKPPPIFINDSQHDALVLFSINCSTTFDIEFVELSISIENFDRIEIRENSSQEFLFHDNFNFSLTVHGKFLGYSQLFLHFDYFDSNRTKFNFSNDFQLDFAVKRKSSILDVIFTVIVIILVCIGTFLIGCRLSSQNLLSNIRRPIPILIGLFSQFFCLPLVKTTNSPMKIIFSTLRSFFFSSVGFWIGEILSFGFVNEHRSFGYGFVTWRWSIEYVHSHVRGWCRSLSIDDIHEHNSRFRFVVFSSRKKQTKTKMNFLFILATFPLWILLLGRDFINTHNVHFP